jgi:hypothetical protein
MTDLVQTDVLIVGAGLCGLHAARVLKEAGVSTVIVDKGRSVGGRMATRRIGDGAADHGAQFFTVRTPEFRALVDAWIAEGLVFEWSRGWSDGSLMETRDGHPRYAVKGGMNALPKRLAEGLNARLNIKITAVSAFDGGWRALDEAGGIYHARAALLTAPVPQSLALLDAGHVALSQEDRAGLESVEYESCIAAMLVIDGDVNLPAPGAIQRPHAPIQWIGDNRRKGVSGVTILTTQASPLYTHQLWDRPDADILSALKVDLMPFLGESSRIVEGQIQRWRYALPMALHPDRFLIASEQPNGAILAFGGDAFGGPRVEGATLSGLAVGRALVERLKG